MLRVTPWSKGFAQRGSPWPSVFLAVRYVNVPPPAGRLSAIIGASNQLSEFESGATAEMLGPVGSVVLGGAGTLLLAALWMH